MSNGRTGIENILNEVRMIKKVEKELPNYNMSVLLQYLEFHEKFLDEKARDFLKNVEVLSEKDLEEFLKRGLDLQVNDDPYVVYYWPAVLPRFFLKLVHIFGYPWARMLSAGEVWFSYFFRYKGHIINVWDGNGHIVFSHMTLHPLGKEDTPPQEGAEEVLKEFAENLLWIAMNVTPLHYLGGGLILL